MPTMEWAWNHRVCSARAGTSRCAAIAVPRPSCDIDRPESVRESAPASECRSARTDAGPRTTRCYPPCSQSNCDIDPRFYAARPCPPAGRRLRPSHEPCIERSGHEEGREEHPPFISARRVENGVPRCRTTGMLAAITSQLMPASAVSCPGAINR